MKHLLMSQLFSIAAPGFALGMLSATLEPALLGYKVLELAPDRRNTTPRFHHACRVDRRDGDAARRRHYDC